MCVARGLGVSICPSQHQAASESAHGATTKEWIKSAYKDLMALPDDVRLLFALLCR
jgi:hypothetical protein